MKAGRCDVTDLELERLKATERPRRETRDEIDPIALVQPVGEIRTTEGDPVEDVALAAQGHLGVSAIRLPHSTHGDPEHADQGIRITGPRRREEGKLAEQRVVDVRGEKSE